MAKRKIKYKPVETDVISAGTAINEFVNVLQVAGQLATQKEDLEGLLEVADRWFDFLKIIEPAEDEEEEPVGDRMPYGFCSDKTILERGEDIGKELAGSAGDEDQGDSDSTHQCW